MRTAAGLTPSGGGAGVPAVLVGRHGDHHSPV